MRYLVTARLRPGKASALAAAISDGTLGDGSVAGDEYVRNMEAARLREDGRVQWVEVCYCPTPLARRAASIGRRIFISTKCRTRTREPAAATDTGEEPWACGDCDCTERLETRLNAMGCRFLDRLDPAAANRSIYTPLVASSSLQPLLARAQAALERGRGAEAVQLLGPALRSSTLSREDELALRSMLAEAWLLQDDLDQAAVGAGPDAGHLSRNRVRWPAVGPVAVARTPGLGARRSVARHRHARPRPQAGRSLARFARASASRTTSSRSATARSATSPSCASTSRRPPRRCTPPAIAGIWRWSTRCRAFHSRSSAATTKR